MSLIQRLENTDSQILLKWLIGICIGIRILFFLLLKHPSIASNSGGYLQLANQLLSFDFKDYLETRTPGYPLFLIF